MNRESTRPSLLDRLRDPEDQLAWREFDETYRELILRYCQRRGLQRWDAEDVRQVVLLSLSQSLRRFRYDPAQGRFRSYLGRVVQNAIHRHVSRPKETAAGLDAGALAQLATENSEPLSPVWEEEWHRHHLRTAMRRVRSEASERDARIFERLLEGQSVRDVAHEFGLGEAATHKVKQRVRNLLRAFIATQLREEDGC